jgi:2-polyprenyl-3-methyl-5-hydroxy-6-metoxy-1,4-benzoquinol methylase
VKFSPVPACWVCGSSALQPFHHIRMDYLAYASQDPELAAYTGETVWIVRCEGCGFAQPDRLPALPRFFDRMYDQRWSDEWTAGEFDATYKDYIFTRILRDLGARVNGGPRRLLDVGAHVGRFMHLAQRSGWEVEGIELNPRTAAHAVARTGAPVHQVNAHELTAGGRRYSAITLTDVLEHVPDPVRLLATLATLLQPGGWIAVKVPCGTSQWHKERTLSALRKGRAICIAENLVHVSHFSPGALTLALERAGFRHPSVHTAPPELPADGSPIPRAASHLLRLGIYGAGRLPGAVHSPLALNLQAYAQVDR